MEFYEKEFFMKTKAVILDKDGTVLDFERFWIPVAVRATEVIMKELGITDISDKKVLEALGVKDGTASILGSLCFGTYRDMAEDTAKVLKEFGYRCDIEKLTEITINAYHNSVDAGKIIPTTPKIKEVMKGLKDKGIEIVLVTSDGPFMTEKCLRGLGIFEYFDIIFTDDGTHPNKPDPFMINKLCADYGFQKTEVVMVGDTLSDMIFAQNGGIRSVGVAKTEENKSILLEKTETVISDISTLLTVL